MHILPALKYCSKTRDIYLKKEFKKALKN